MSNILNGAWLSVEWVPGPELSSSGNGDEETPALQGWTSKSRSNHWPPSNAQTLLWSPGWLWGPLYTPSPYSSLKSESRCGLHQPTRAALYPGVDLRWQHWPEGVGLCPAACRWVPLLERCSSQPVELRQVSLFFELWSRWSNFNSSVPPSSLMTGCPDHSVDGMISWQLSRMYGICGWPDSSFASEK